MKRINPDECSVVQEASVHFVSRGPGNCWPEIFARAAAMPEGRALALPIKSPKVGSIGQSMRQHGYNKKLTIRRGQDGRVYLLRRTSNHAAATR